MCNLYWALIFPKNPKTSRLLVYQSPFCLKKNTQDSDGNNHWDLATIRKMSLLLVNHYKRSNPFESLKKVQRHCSSILFLCCHFVLAACTDAARCCARVGAARTRWMPAQALLSQSKVQSSINQRLPGPGLLWLPPPQNSASQQQCRSPSPLWPQAEA